MDDIGKCIFQMLVDVFSVYIKIEAGEDGTVEKVRPKPVEIHKTIGKRRDYRIHLDWCRILKMRLDTMNLYIFVNFNRVVPNCGAVTSTTGISLLLKGVNG